MMENEGNTKSDTTTAEATRIFVGGLGENVSENDVEKIFASLSVGKIEGIEIIRTKGRSFAYFNIVPSSDKSLPKLFSMYNGCMWKGGRLKLEKAKEHYLDRLRHEWEDDEVQALAQAQPPPEVQLLQITRSSNNAKSNPNKFEDPKEQQEKLKIFFPKLGKVKLLPISGTGKHKYSFQRPKVLPPVPLHFCDCEEHAIDAPAPAAARALVCGKRNNIRDEELPIGGMNEDEINLMGSVMKKLFERENSSKSAIVHSRSKTERPKEGDFAVKSTDDLQADENEPDNTEDNLQPEENEPDISDDEEDNLVLNLASKSNDIEALLGSWPKKSISSAETNLASKRGSKSGPVQKPSQEETKNIPRIKKVKFHLPEETGATHSGQPDSARTYTSSVEKPLEDHSSLPESDVKQLSSDVSSSRKSSWKALVGDNKTNKSSFSISKLLSNTDNEELPIPDSSNVHDSSNSKKKNSKKRKTLEEKLENTKVEHVVAGSFSVSDLLSNPDMEELPKSDSSIVHDSSNNKKKNLKKRKTLEEKLEKTKIEHGVAEAKPVTTNTLTAGSGWFQKSPWTQMVNENNSSFSIAQISPAITLEMQKAVEPVTVEKNNGSNLEDQHKNNPVLTSAGRGNEGDVKNLAVENQDIDAGNVEASNDASVVGEHDVSQNKISFMDIGKGDTCHFMRNAASLKEWSNIKASLNRTSKRKTVEKK